MEFPQSKRDRIVMGLSICALILFVANMATFIKQRFFDKHASEMVVYEEALHDHAIHITSPRFLPDGQTLAFSTSRLGDGPSAWHITHLADGNQAWVMTHNSDCDDDRRLIHEELVLKLNGETDRLRHRLRHRLERHHRFAEESAELSRQLAQQRLELARQMSQERYRELLQTYELELQNSDLELPRLKIETLTGDDVKVEETQDETGRRRYRVIVRPGNDQ